MISFYRNSRWGFRKIVQNGQTEQKQDRVLAFGSRRCQAIGEVCSQHKAIFILKIRPKTNFNICFCYFFVIRCFPLTFDVSIFLLYAVCTFL